MKKYVFVTGMGRSGTMFLSRLLDGLPSVAARHEYIGSREFWLLSWYLEGQVYSEAFLVKEKQRIDAEFSEDKVFIDVNGLLQNSVAELERVFPGAQVFHLVRDGRRVVRSIYSRRNDKDIHLIPKDRRTVEHWLESDKFWQICWNWNDTTRRLIATGKPVIKFEKIISDYGYLRKNFLEPTGIDLPEAVWGKAREKKVNETRSFLYRFLHARAKGKAFVPTELPEYRDWPEEKKAIFEETCGETMRSLGYNI